MAEEHVVAEPGEHRRRDLAREGSLVLGVAVLGPEAERASPEHLPDADQVGEGRQHLHLHPAAVQLGPHGTGQLQPVGDGGVHLPVAGDQPGRTSGAHSVTLSWSAATPGSSLPSRYSRVAPPPVETWLILSATPAWSRAAARSPPPTTLVAEEAPRASATWRVPRAKSSISEIPSGPFQTTVPAVRQSSEICAQVSGPASTTIWSAGISVQATMVVG